MKGWLQYCLGLLFLVVLATPPLAAQAGTTLPVGAEGDLLIHQSSSNRVGRVVIEP